jgi:hypothetical protein
MSNYLNAFYGADNAFCGVMTSVMYANEIQGVNMTGMDNGLLGSQGFKYHLSGGVSVKTPNLKNESQFPSNCSSTGILGEVRSFLKNHFPSHYYLPGTTTSPGGSAAGNYTVMHTFRSLTWTHGDGKGAINGYNCSFIVNNWTDIASATIGGLTNYEGYLAKKDPSKLKAFAATVQTANTEFSNIKNQAQTGVSLVNGLVGTDGDELTAGVNLLSAVLQGLASPVTVS